MESIPIGGKKNQPQEAQQKCSLAKFPFPLGRSLVILFHDQVELAEAIPADELLSKGNVPGETGQFFQRVGLHIQVVALDPSV